MRDPASIALTLQTCGCACLAVAAARNGVWPRSRPQLAGFRRQLVGYQSFCSLTAGAIRCTIDALAASVPVLVFCHLGVGRSPLVLAIALERARGLPREQAMAAVKSIRPGAAFSPAALAVWTRLDAEAA